MRQPNYHSYWREWMHSRHWVMSAQFQGIHSLNALLLGPSKACRGFYLFSCKFVLQPLWQYCYLEVTAKLWKVCQQIKNVYVQIPDSFFPFHAETGGAGKLAADSRLDCHAYDSCVPFTFVFPYDIADVGMVPVWSPEKLEELGF